MSGRGLRGRDWLGWERDLHGDGQGLVERIGTRAFAGARDSVLLYLRSRGDEGIKRWGWRFRAVARVAGASGISHSSPHASSPCFLTSCFTPTATRRYFLAPISRNEAVHRPVTRSARKDDRPGLITTRKNKGSYSEVPHLVCCVAFSSRPSTSGGAQRERPERQGAARPPVWSGYPPLQRG